MVAGKEPVLAKQARWTAVMAGDDIVEFIGSFPRGSRHAALGTMRFLNRSLITEGDRAFEDYNDGSIIRLSSKQGDHMAKFAAWAYKHDLVPGLKRQTDRREEEAMLQEIEESRLHEMRFTPWSAAEARKAIRGMCWETAEGPCGGAPGSANLVTDIADPELAFQAAYYLHKKHFISPAQFDRHKGEINMALDHGEKNVLFRMAIPPDKAQAFERQFPDAGQWPKPERDEPDRNPRHGQARHRPETSGVRSK
jgi:hypothetical protein